MQLVHLNIEAFCSSQYGSWKFILYKTDFSYSITKQQNYVDNGSNDKKNNIVKGIFEIDCRWVKMSWQYTQTMYAVFWAKKSFHLHSFALSKLNMVLCCSTRRLYSTIGWASKRKAISIERTCNMCQLLRRLFFNLNKFRVFCFIPQ